MSLYESTRAREDADPFTDPWVELDDNGHRVVRDAGQYLRTDRDWLRQRWPSMLHGDEIWLDDAGVYRYRPSDDRRLQQLAGAFTAYERIGG